MVYMKNRRPISQMDEEDFAPDSELVSKAPRSGGFAKTLMIIVIIVIIFFGCWFLASKTLGVGFIGSDNIAQVSSDWQAIFLSNGQVYFGKVKGVSDKALVLNDIYYLQVVTKPLQGTQAGTNDQQQQELTLVKLGNEIHGPYDQMIINRDQVLLTEKLKNDSRVVQAINDYVTKQKQDKTKAQTPAATQTK